MAQNTILTVTGQWTLVTDSDVTSLTYQNFGPAYVEVAATVGAVTAPDDENGAGYYRAEATKGGEALSLADVFPGLAGANRIWMRAPGGPTTSVFISHG